MMWVLGEKGSHYSTEMKLSDYIERRQKDRIFARIAEECQGVSKSAKEPKTLGEMLKERLRPCVGHAYESDKIEENNMNCKVQTKDKVEWIEGQAPKFDGGKIRLDLLPVRPLKDTAQVLTYGLDKYGKDSWREGKMIDWSRCYSALQRHLFAWQSGEDTDPETGFSHLAHASCNLLMLIEHSYINKQGDDRPKTAALYND